MTTSWPGPRQAAELALFVRRRDRPLRVPGDWTLGRAAEGRGEAGTRRSYQVFSRCQACGQVYWRGAHAARLEAIVQAAIRIAG
jgi:hypothetical protein